MTALLQALIGIMTALLQALITFLILVVFAIVIMSLVWVLRSVDEGEYKKAIITSIFAIILTILMFTGMAIAF